MKKVLLLGGSMYLLSVIETCHRLGYKAITCDYIEDNIAHKYSDEYYNVSVVDKEAVLALAQKLQIDGIVSFACDPGVVTAAYVAEKMGLPFQGSYESNCILQDKGRFRQFLLDNGFNSPHAKSFDNVEEAMKSVDYFNWPVIVKPVDSAGSKGVSRADDPAQLPEAIEKAIGSSISGRFIIEDFLTFEGYHNNADDFTVDGKLTFCTYGDSYFDKDAANPYAPILSIWPSSMRQECQDELTRETQRLMTLLGMKTGIYNIETCVGSDGTPYIMEVSCRGGGGMVAEMESMATGIDFIEAELRKAVGEPVPEMHFDGYDGVWCLMLISSMNNESGTFKELYIEPDMMRDHVKRVELSIEPGGYVAPYTGANMAIGNLFLHFDTREELDEALADRSKWMKIVLE